MRPWAYDSEKNVHKQWEQQWTKIIHEMTAFFWQRDSSMRLNADWMEPNDSGKEGERKK